MAKTPLGRNCQKKAQLVKNEMSCEIKNYQNLDSKTRKSCSKIDFLSRRGEKQDDSPTLHLGSCIHRFLIYLTKYIFPLISGSGGGTIENGFIPIMYGQGD